jgi:hypothetical protein
VSAWKRGNHGFDTAAGKQTADTIDMAAYGAIYRVLRVQSGAAICLRWLWR